ncbi:MAG TPA: restriction endonuclease subunit S [bacterium]|nr:restriction endonuclease subunit S [bacterium]
MDQIESHTGNIVNKKIAPASAAGTSTNVFDDGNVLYSKLRPYLNKVLCPTEPGIATTELVPLRPRKDLLERRYLTYYLRSNHFLGFANVAVAGVKMPRIIMAKFWKHHIPLPPLSEQQRIVEILDQANALRKKRAEADAIAARILPALFYKMFGDPLANPHGLPMETVGTLLTLLRNGTTAEQNQDGRGFPVTRIETISAGVINPDRVRYVDFDDSELNKWRLEPGDILFSHINSESHIGKTAIYKGQPDPLIHGMNLLLMRADAKQVRPEYLFAVLNTDSVRAAYRQRCKRAVNQASLNQKDISSLEIAVPPIDAQDRFCLLAGNLLQQVETQQKATENIEKLSDNLIHRAFTGDLTAKWREAHMKELLQEMEQQAKALNVRIES